MEYGIGVRTRWSWDPVTDAGGSPRAEADVDTGKSGFRFDLGGALARLDEDEPLDGDEPQQDQSVPAVLRRDDAAESVGFDPPRVIDPSHLIEPVPTVESAPTVEPARAAGRLPAFEYKPVLEDGPIGEAAPSPSASGIPTDHRRVESDPISELANQPLPRRSRSGSSPAAKVPVIAPQIHDSAQISEPILAPATEQPVATRSTPIGSVFDPSALASARPTRRSNVTAPTRGTAPGTPVGRAGAVLPTVTGALPTLPAPEPLALPQVVAPIDSAPSTPDISALRSAQLRANRQQNQGKVFGRSLLSFIVIGILIAAALIYGRAYLFPTEWDAALTPIVDDIQETTGIEFDHTIPLVVQTPGEYATNLLESTLGSGWVANVAQWRALGLADGEITAPEVAVQLADRTAAYYDPAADSIFQAEGRPNEEIRPALESAMLEAFQRQLQVPVEGVDETGSFGLTGVSGSRTLTRRAVDTYLVRRSADAMFGPTIEAATEDGATEVDLPIPIAYELAAVDRLGESILTAAGTDPATLQTGAAYPDAIYGAFGDSPNKAGSAPLREDEQPLADAVALGVDDWSLVWGSRLPAASVDRSASIVTSDSYQPVSRNGTTCFVAVFQTSTDANGAALFASMRLWAQRAPAASQALATQLAPEQVQLEACDPGVGVSIMPDPAVVDGVIAQQIDRLAG